MAACVLSPFHHNTKSIVNNTENQQGHVVSLCSRTYNFKKAKNECIGHMCSSELFALHSEEEEDNFLLIMTIILLKIMTEGDKRGWGPKLFYAPNGLLPTISFDAYLTRIFKYGQFSKECFLRALIYIDKLIEGGFVFNSYNMHRGFLVSIITAAKFFEDEPCDNKYYALVGGIPIEELNALELQFLFMVDWKINITPSEYERYEMALRYRLTKQNLPQALYMPSKPARN